MRNTHPVPTAAMSSPATPGPISRAALKDALFRPTAFDSLCAGTSSATNVCRTGPSMAVTHPRVSANRYTCHSCACPLSTRTPSPAASTP